MFKTTTTTKVRQAFFFQLFVTTSLFELSYTNLSCLKVANFNIFDCNMSKPYFNPPNTHTHLSSDSLWGFLSSAGGYAAGSLAIMTDAAHLLTDFGSIAINIFSLWISSRPLTQTMTFGWHRAGEKITCVLLVKNKFPGSVVD